jgi:DNA polymerase III subunit epsilon
MKILVFDTETTGFIDKKETDISKQPRIVQFAAILWDILPNGKFEETQRINILMTPGIPIPYAASQVHHIYDVDVRDAPKIDEKIDEILSYINSADLIIWHNIEYDEGVLWVELDRLQKRYAYQPKQTFCTMKTTVDFCAIQGNGERLKYPKLGELHKKLFGEYFIGAHDALVDVEATLRCFLELKKKWIIHIKEKPESVMSLF